MKKYLLGLFAVVVAVAFSAFTTKKAVSTLDYGFVSQSSTATTLTLVVIDPQTPGYVNDGCSQTAKEACKVAIDPADISASGTPFIIQSVSGTNNEIKTLTLDLTSLNPDDYRTLDAQPFQTAYHF